MIERRIPIVRELERRMRRGGGRAAGTIAARATALRLARQSGDPVRLRRALLDLVVSCVSGAEALSCRSIAPPRNALLANDDAGSPGSVSAGGRSVRGRVFEVMRCVLAVLTIPRPGGR